MTEPFELPVNYQGIELMLPTRLLMQGYVYKFQVTINSCDVLFERDESGDFRALVNEVTVVTEKLDVRLLQAIAESLQLL